MPSLDKKYRPKTFKTFFGNEDVITSLKAHFKDMDTFPSSILLKGPSGCGKTTLARMIARKLKIKSVYELNVADSRKIEDARRIIDNLRYASIEGSGKVIILNECHEAIKTFQDALLELIEEPPENVYFILSTTDPQKLLEAIRTRVTPFLVSKLSRTEMEDLVKWISKKESIKVGSKVSRAILNAAEGIPRVGLLLLNEIKGVKGTETKLKRIESFIPDMSPQVIELCRTLLKGPTYKEVMRIAKDIEEDPERIRRSIMTYMSKVLLSGPNKNAAIVMDNCFETWYWTGRAGMILSLYHILEGE